MKHKSIKSCMIRQGRPGIIKPFMIPVKLQNQVRSGAKKSQISFRPDGKTLVGGVQWAAQIERPGLAKPLIVAKQEQAALKKGLAMEKQVVRGKAKAKARAKARVIDELAAKSAKAKPLSGWFY